MPQRGGGLLRIVWSIIELPTVCSEIYSVAASVPTPSNVWRTTISTSTPMTSTLYNAILATVSVLIPKSCVQCSSMLTTSHIIMKSEIYVSYNCHGIHVHPHSMSQNASNHIYIISYYTQTPCVALFSRHLIGQAPLPTELTTTTFSVSSPHSQIPPTSRWVVMTGRLCFMRRD